MRGKYAGAMLKATKVGGKRYTTVKSLNKARLLAQAAEKVTHGKVIQAGEIYRDDLIEAILEVLIQEGFADVAKDPSFAKKSFSVHQSPVNRAKFSHQGKSYSASRSTAGKTTFKRRFLGGLIKRKVGSVSPGQ